jgi:hypothetical protein
MHTEESESVASGLRTRTADMATGACHVGYNAVQSGSRRTAWRWSVHQGDEARADRGEQLGTCRLAATFGVPDVAVASRTVHSRPSSSSRPLMILVFLATLMLLQSPARARIQQQRDWPSLGDDRVLKIAGESIDTVTSPSVLHETDPRRGAMSNTSFAQYYVQFKPNADQRALHQVCFLECVQSTA